MSAGLNEFDSCIRVATATVGIGDTVPRPIANGMFTSMKRQLTRRRMLGSSAGVVAAPVSLSAAPASQRDFLKELGVRPIINGAGVVYVLDSFVDAAGSRGGDPIHQHQVRPSG